MIDQRIAALLVEVVATPRPVVLIDGGAGSGKSTLAEQMLSAWPGPPPQLVSLDEFYPGWHGLEEAAQQVPEVITGHGFHRWDWGADAPGKWRDLDPDCGLIIEGCGAITAASRSLAGLAIWLEAPELVRRERALARDGEVFARHWQTWALQEAEHWRRDRPWVLADLVIQSA